MALKIVKNIQNKEIDVVENTKKVLEQVKKLNKEYNFLNTISEELAIEQAEELAKNPDPKGILSGVPITIKDSICVKGVESTAGSKILKGYKPVFNATAVQKCIDEGAIIIGKSAQDEFGFGAFSTNIGIGLKTPLNPFDKERACGGSSGGAAAIAQKMGDLGVMSMGESTGGSIVNPASFCGVFGMCPTYGRVSRYGIMDYGNSLDKLGPIAKTIEEVAVMMRAMSGFDEKESTSLNEPVEDYSNYLKKDLKGMKIGVIKEAFGEGTDKQVEKKVWEGIKKLESNGAKYEEVSLSMPIEYGIPTYYMIATSEASTNLAKYCGMRYGLHEKLEGNFNEYFTKVRSNNFGKEAKRRIMLGTFARLAGYRDAYYIKAMKVRTLIIKEYKKVFKKFDLLATPTVPMLPPRFDETDKMTPLQNYMADVMTAPPNLAGLPHLNVPVGLEKKDGKELPVGLLLTGDHLQEGKLIQAGKEFK
ncbi:amidase family protein [candidate division KSB1 bacterium]